jgi:hypothetical protein
MVMETNPTVGNFYMSWQHPLVQFHDSLVHVGMCPIFTNAQQS